MHAATAPAVPVARLDSLTSLRWWAAFAVFLFHMRNMVTFPPWLQWFVEQGHHGVTFFFVLSGFVLTWSWRRETPVRAFYWRRFARIYPLHLIALLVAIPVFYRMIPNADQGWIKPLDWGVLVLSFLVIQGWSRDPVILFSGNPAAWTLTVEAFFYALHPLLIRMMVPLRKYGALGVGALIFTVSLLLKLGALTWPDSVFAALPQPIYHVPAFIIGMLAAWAFRNGWRLHIPVLIPGGALILWLLVSVLAGRSTGPLSVLSAMTAEVVALLCVFVIAAAATSDINGTTRIGSWRPLVLLGEWSFAFYLIHATFMYAAIEIFGGQHGSYWRTLFWGGLLLGLSILGSWFLHRFVEKPVEKKFRGWQDRRLRAKAVKVS
ncbi:acyltransferase [Microbacterium sp. NC79]|uniref:acyltransferase family protein n=1 Tax=Microbacterium sp. NC79 TaxID=2851009 RepID=UPI0020B84704|nr:acyltransferase [Microbacterium sp. NC79]